MIHRDLAALPSIRNFELLATSPAILKTLLRPVENRRQRHNDDIPLCFAPKIGYLILQNNSVGGKTDGHATRIKIFTVSTQYCSPDVYGPAARQSIHSAPASHQMGPGSRRKRV